MEESESATWGGNGGAVCGPSVRAAAVLGAEPQLEAVENPQANAVIPDSRLMLAPQPLDRLGVQVSPLARHAGAQHLVDPLLRRAEHPGSDGDGEPFLGAAPDLGRQPRIDDLVEEPLGPSVPDVVA